MKKPDFVLPFDPLVGDVVEPILSDETSDLLMDAIMPIQKQGQWRAWEMQFLKANMGAILLEGPVGTGKTTIARWLAKKLGRGMVEFSMAEIGSEEPGETERNLHKIFQLATKKKECTLFLDECDGILWGREHVSKDSMWMLGVKGTLLKEIDKYPGLIVMATNLPQLLDAALARRVTRIHVDAPEFLQRCKLWESKLPPKFFYPSQSEINQLAKIELTGAQIENTIIATAKTCLRLDKQPTLKLLLKAAGSARKSEAPKKSPSANHEVPLSSSHNGTSASMERDSPTIRSCS